MLQPKFKNIQEYQKAQLLMQPIFIRVLDNIRKQVELSEWESKYEEINHPFPSYLLTLTKKDQIIQYNIWELCFQVCFQSYQPNQTELVETDDKLIDERGEIDWQILEKKTQNLISQIMAI